MLKLMVMFRAPEQVESFENAYNDFLALIERMPDVRRRQVVHVTGSPVGAPAFHRILEIYFDSQAAMQAALLTPAGQEAGGELRRFRPGSFEVMFAEVYEEAGGSTEAPAQQPTEA